MNKYPLIGGSICAVVLIVLASLTNVVGYQTNTHSSSISENSITIANIESKAGWTPKRSVVIEGHTLLFPFRIWIHCQNYPDKQFDFKSLLLLYTDLDALMINGFPYDAGSVQCIGFVGYIFMDTNHQPPLYISVGYCDCCLHEIF